MPLRFQPSDRVQDRTGRFGFVVAVFLQVNEVLVQLDAGGVLRARPDALRRALEAGEHPRP